MKAKTLRSESDGAHCRYWSATSHMNSIQEEVTGHAQNPPEMGASSGGARVCDTWDTSIVVIDVSRHGASEGREVGTLFGEAFDELRLGSGRLKGVEKKYVSKQFAYRMDRTRLLTCS